MFYEFNQNNSGGSFVVDDKVCHNLFIESNSLDEAIVKAESLGCYWNGVADGIDCPCCGDRWHSPWHEFDIDKYIKGGYEVSVYGGIFEDTISYFNKKYDRYKFKEEPRWEKTYSSKCYMGKIIINNIEECAQFMADEYGWTIPDIRIYYFDGSVKEIYLSRLSESN